MSITYLGLGSNVGEREQQLLSAVRLIADIGVIVSQSSIYETEPVGFRDQPLFLNMVLGLDVILDLHTLLFRTQAIEHSLGRVRTIQNGPRTIDIDILLYGDAVVSSATLVIPHARLYERAFMLVPLAEIAPDAVHPILKKNIGTLLAEVFDRNNVSLYGAKNS